MAGNFNTNFTPVKGTAGSDWVMKKLPIIASVEMESGSALYAVGDGTHTIVTTTSGNFAGIIAEPIASTDADYATSKKLKTVWVPVTSKAECLFTCTGLTTTYIGANADFATATTVAPGTSTHDQVTITGFISSTRGRCRFNPNIE